MNSDLILESLGKVQKVVSQRFDIRGLSRGLELKNFKQILTRIQSVAVLIEKH
jgi:hypothetical protein